MNVKIYASGELAYDSQLPVEEHFSILSAQIQEGINKGGMATLLLPPDHRLYDGFPAMRTCVEIYRDDKLRWRGRALAHEDDFWGRRTVPCEGELCFLNDSSMRPYALHGSPQDLLGQILGVHNATVDPWKRLALGTVTIPTRDITVESKMPEKCYTTVQRLLKEAGGYLIIDTAADGQRQLNWYATLPDNCNQFIRLGENLLDYDSSANIAGIATRIVPYGAAGKDGKRIQINVDGRDYVDNLEAQALRGIIEVPRVYNEITDPEVLRKVAERDVMTSGMLPERIKLSAVDLSRVDATLDQFAVGQMVHAESGRHKLSGTYAIVELAEDLVQPSSGSISLVRDAMYYDGIPTLSGSVAADLRQQASDLSAQGAQIMADMQVAIEAATSWLTNGQGYKVERRDPRTGQVIDTLYLDTPDINKAVNVLRMGQSGIGFSHSGVDGPYVSAWTIDGKFNASFILAGVLTATIIKTGILSDKLGRNYLNLDTGETRIHADELTICGKTPLEIAEEAAGQKFDNLTQAQLFDKLTNNGQIEGLYMRGSKLYINATYIVSGEIASENRNIVLDLDNGVVSINKGTINLGNGNFKVDNSGFLQAVLGVIGGLKIGNGGLFSDHMGFEYGRLSFKDGSRNVGVIAPTIKTNRSPNAYRGINLIANGATDAIVISQEDNPNKGQVAPLFGFARSSCGGAFTSNAFNFFADIDMNGRVLRNAQIDTVTSGARGGYTGTVGVGGYTLSFEGGFLMDVY